MPILIIVNSKLSSKTASFWGKNSPQIESGFPKARYLVPEDECQVIPENFDLYESVILIGDTPFFNRVINHSFDLISQSSKNKTFAFIPDTKESSVRSNFQLPVKIDDQIAVIQSQQCMPHDLIRCHYIDNEGSPANCLVLNDILMGVPVSKLPLLLKAFVQWIKIASNLSQTTKQRTIQLKKGDQVIFEGNYLFSLILLGNKITDGTLILSKARVSQKSFDYVQFSTQLWKSYGASLPQLLSGNIKDNNENLFHRQFDRLEIKGSGKEHEMIADGIHIGRLPASFTLLPNAISVVSPRLFNPIKANWSKQIGKQALPAVMPQMPRRHL